MYFIWSWCMQLHMIHIQKRILRTFNLKLYLPASISKMEGQGNLQDWQTCPFSKFRQFMDKNSGFQVYKISRIRLILSHSLHRRFCLSSPLTSTNPSQVKKNTLVLNVVTIDRGAPKRNTLQNSFFILTSVHFV